jgi:RNA polymerase sigma factor (sigma-70 family)
MTNNEIVLLVNECLAGKRESYSPIIRCFQGKIFALCFHFMGTSPDAEDAAMEVFIKAYRKLKGYNPQYAFSTWLFKIAVNHCIGLLRRQKREKEYLDTQRSNPARTIEANSPEVIFFKDTRQTALENAVNSLPVKYRTALILKYQQDLSYRQISEIMEIPVNTVGSLILRGKKELREVLK